MAPQPVYLSDGCEIDLARRELRLRGTVAPVGARSFDILDMLVQAGGRLVTKQDLTDHLWPGIFVADNTLQVHISALRKALGPYRGILKTEAGRGYRLLGVWSVQGGAEPPLPAQSDRILIPANEPFRTNFPAAASRLIGRGNAVQQLRDLLTAYRVVTLTGPGGIGKTSLALDAVRTLLPDFGGDGWLIELAALSNPDLVPTAVASVLGLGLGGDWISEEGVARAIGNRKLILVIDSCEHIVDAVARLAETLIRLCPLATLVATSREVLRIEGEHVYRVPALDVPPQFQDNDLLDHSAVELFIARIQALASDFLPDPENLAAIAAICRRLDGVPLAIEFAAARAATLGPVQVLSRLNDRFGLLAGGRRTALPRHRTLRATLDWSYDLLSEAERRLLRRVAVFAGGFTLEAAAFVMADTEAQIPSVADGIANLVSKSLVTLSDTNPVSRWRLLETIRAYALEKLDEAGEGRTIARRHAEYFRDLVAPATTSSVLRLSIDDVTRYGREIDDVRTALDWAFSPAGDTATGVLLTAAFAPVWLHLSLAGECRECAERALTSLANDGIDIGAPLERRLHIALGVALILTMGPVERTKAVVAKARALAESVDDLEAQLQMLWAQWSVEFTIGECLAAQITAERFAEVARSTGDEAAVLVAERLIGNSLQHVGRPREAQPYFERVLDGYTAPTNQRHTILFHYDQHSLARAMLARVLWLQGSLDRAKDQARASLEEARAAEPGFSLCWVLHYAVCPIALLTGDIAAAEHAVMTMATLGSSLNTALWRLVARCWEGKLLIEQGQPAAGADLLRGALETCERTGWLFYYPQFMGMLAEAQRGLGQPKEALVTIDRALAQADRGGDRWYVPELLRLKGELLRSAEEPSGSAGEEYFHRALNMAEEQGASFWALRAVMSLARSKATAGSRAEARDLLAPVYARFTEGLETADMRNAKVLLETLGG